MKVKPSDNMFLSENHSIICCSCELLDAELVLTNLTSVLISTYIEEYGGSSYFIVLIKFIEKVKLPITHLWLESLKS